MVEKKTVKCLCCGKEFVREHNAQKHCSAKCRIAWNTSKEAKAKYNIKMYTCSWCGITFESPQKKKYCSDECRVLSYKGKRKKPKRQTALSIQEVSKLAREAGLSYGQYVAKMGL